MKNIFVKTISRAAFVILMMTMIAQVRVSAQDPVSAQDVETEDQGKDQTQEDKSSRRRIVGIWDVQVTIRVCQTGAAIRTFASIGTFNSGGTALDLTSGIPPSLRTPGQGVWNHIGGRDFRLKFKSFTFDASGNFTGWTIINHRATLNRWRDEYESAGTGEVYSPTGVLLFTGCATTTAVRFE